MSHQPKYLLISSKNRNCERETSTNFTVHLKHGIKEAVGCKLIYLNLPNTIYNVNDSNNKLYLEYGPGFDEVTITLTNGCYNIDQFITEVSTQLNNSGSGTWTVGCNSTTLKITITNTTNFIIKKGDNSANELLGFCNKEYNSGFGVPPILG